MKKNLFLLLSLMALPALSQSFSVDGLTYTVASAADGSVSVTGCDPAAVEPTLVIPATVESGGMSYSVEQIGDRALADCDHIKSLTLPESISSIGTKAFFGSDMDAVKCYAVVPPTMGEQAFSDNTYANAVLTVYKSSLGNYRYVSPEWSKFVNMVSMPDPPVEIDGLLFDEYTGARYSMQLVGYKAASVAPDLVIPESVTNPNAFMSYQVKAVASDALRGAPIRSVEFPSVCEIIGAGAVAECADLDSIVVPSSVTSIGANFTAGCNSLKAVMLLGGGGNLNLGTAESAALASGAYTLYISRTIAFSGQPDESPFANDALKRVVYNYPVSKGFNAGLFEKSTALTAVEFGAKSSAVCAGVFRGCESLKEVTFSAYFKTIGDEAFAGCRSLTVVRLPETLTSVGARAFADIAMDSVICASAEPIALPDDAFSAETYAGAVLVVPAGAVEAYKAADGWKNFVSIKEVGEEDRLVEFTTGGLTYRVLSKTDKTVGVCGYDAETLPEMLEMPSVVEYDGVEYTVTETAREALSGSAVKYVKFPSTVATLARGMLMQCASLDSIVVPASVTVIEPFFAYGCSNLRAVVMEAGTDVLHLGDRNDMALTSGSYTLYLARPIEPVKSGSFYYSPFECESLARLVLYPEAGDCNNLFIACSALRSVTMVEGRTSVSDRMFINLAALDSVAFPATLTSIGSRSFENCKSLKRITFPEKLQTIGASAFSNVKMDSIVCLSNIPPTLGGSVFTAGTYAEAILLVPEGMSGYYAESDGWKNFVTIKEIGQDDKPLEFTSDGLIYEVVSADEGLVAVVGYDPETLPKRPEIPAAVTYEDADYTVTVIAEGALREASVERVGLPSTLTIIGNEAFAGCGALTNITLPESLESIGESAFARIEMDSVVCLSVVPPVIDATVFGDVTYAEAILLVPEGMSGCYAEADGWKNFVTIKEIGQDDSPLEFTSDGLIYEVVSADEGVVAVVGYDPETLPKRPEIPAAVTYEDADYTVTVIAEGALREASVERVGLPSTLTIIGNEAFAGCGALTNITLPESLELIGESAFARIEMDSVVCLSVVPPVIDATVFGDVTYAEAILVVPDGRAKVYSEAEGWKEFGRIVEAGVASTMTVGVDDTNATVTVVDMSGRVVYVGPLGSMPELRRGIYIIKTKNDSRKIIEK